LARRLKSLAKAQRQKKYKVSAIIHRKISNIRKDFNHKLSRKLVRGFDILCLEDISVEDWLTNISNINRSIYDVGIGQLVNFIVYKAESAGKQVVFVNPAYTTQTCCNCGKLNPIKITQRTYSCDCGYVADRDINASHNILRLGLQSLLAKAS